MEFSRPKHKAKLIHLSLHLVEEPTDSSVWLPKYGIDTVLFWEASYSPKGMTFNQDKKSIFVYKRNAFLHTHSSVLAEKAELGNRQYCPHLFRWYYSTLMSNRPSSSVLFGHDSLPSQSGLNCKTLVIFTKLPLTDRSDFSSSC